MCFSFSHRRLPVHAAGVAGVVGLESGRGGVGETHHVLREVLPRLSRGGCGGGRAATRQAGTRTCTTRLRSPAGSNRREYENTLNDLFGVRLNLQQLLPEDGRFHEFDNVGQSLGLSRVHLERYMEAASAVLDASIETTTEATQPQPIEAAYVGTREAERFAGRVWKQLEAPNARRPCFGGSRRRRRV